MHTSFGWDAPLLGLGPLDTGAPAHCRSRLTRNCKVVSVSETSRKGSHVSIVRLVCAHAPTKGVTDNETH